MNKVKLHTVWRLGMLFLMTACGDDEDYYYPPVKLEFVTVKAGADGLIKSLLPDKGKLLTVSKDRTGSSISPNTARRVISNYEVNSDDATAVIYSLQSVVAPEPKEATDPAFEGGLKYDPVDVTSIWMGRDYLNMILNVKIDINSGKQHVFGMVEESVESEGDEKVVTLSLFHNANGDEEIYNRRAYVSVPLTKYVDEENPHQTIRIKFKYHTTDTSGTVVESEKYCNPGFEYIPDEN